ncbi:matrixin family metalloprotease [Aquipuribacter nitratireducens]|uniref:Matrixin family metalloprotease n=1 Tax=Aquipuribacter nitratireducens TaxID=650104 RepID=A0ABW0GIM3_9MICO
MRGAAVVVASLAVVAAVLLGATLAGGRVGMLAEPGVPADAAAAPLRLPPDVVDPGGYTFMATLGDVPGGEPVRWDPCRPVHVVVRPDREPAGGRRALEVALDEVGRATGLVFVVDGETDEPPAAQRAVVDRARYGDRWSPVLVTWTDAAEHPPLAGAAGMAGPQGWRSGGHERWVSGTVALDAAWFAASLPEELGRRRAEAVLVHELSHLVGLGHSADPFSLMSPAYQSVYDLSTADRAGLARLGAGPCEQVGDGTTARDAPAAP